MLIISTIREAPQTKSQSFTRAMYLIPSIVCAFLLAGMGETISVMDMSHEEIHNQTNTVVTIHEHYSITLVLEINLQQAKPIQDVLHIHLSIYVISSK
jgi:hypothetical protein